MPLPDDDPYGEKRRAQYTAEILAGYPVPWRWIARMVYAIQDIGRGGRLRRAEKKHEAWIASLPPEERKKHVGLAPFYRRRDMARAEKDPFKEKSPD